jgi:hypothetical protein
LFRADEWQLAVYLTILAWGLIESMQLIIQDICRRKRAKRYKASKKGIKANA